MVVVGVKGLCLLIDLTRPFITLRNTRDCYPLWVSVKLFTYVTSSMLRISQLPIRCCSRRKHHISLLYHSSQGPGTGETVPQHVEKTKEKDSEDEIKPLPLLQRPLGVKERPTTASKTTLEQFNEMMDQDKRMEHRRHLYVTTEPSANRLIF